MVLRPTLKLTHLEVIQRLSGGYSQESTTTYQSGSSSNTTSTTNNTNAYIQATQELCLHLHTFNVSNVSGALRCRRMWQVVSTFGLGVSGGTYRTDENCERIKLSKVLNELGMKVFPYSMSRYRVFFAMEQSGTLAHLKVRLVLTAKINGKNLYRKLRPNFDIYTERLKIVQKADKKKQKELRRTKIKRVGKLMRRKKLMLEMENDEWNEVDKETKSS